jgi:putative ATP-dependent endonuclease of OLD family
VVAKEIQQKGAEVLMAEEAPLDRQWQYLEALRAEDTDGRFGIPAARPADDELRKLTTSTLKGLKGEGGAAKLLQLCAVAELPKTITDFLADIYQRYPKPRRKEVPAPQADANAEAAGNNQAAAEDPEEL